MNEETDWAGIEQHMESGEVQKDVAELFNTTPWLIRDHFGEEKRDRWAQIRAQHSARREKEAKQKKKYKKESKILLVVKEHAAKQTKFRLKDAGRIDLWDYSKEYDKFGYKDIMTYEGIFAVSTLNIPFPYYQPAKRLQDISQGLLQKGYTIEPETDIARERRLTEGGYRLVGEGKNRRRIGKIKYQGKKIWYGIWNWVRLDRPELPIINVARHDVDTLNASVGFADSMKDRLLTQEDSCFVSQSFADRFTYVTQHKAVYFTNDEMPSEKEVKEGDCIEKIPEEEQLTLKNTVKHSGTWRKTNQRRKNVLWVSYGLITANRKLQVGDKILGLTGLKVTVCDIRANQDKDIVIHPKQVISKGKKAVKEAMVKELQECGKIMVGMRKDQVLGNYEKISSGGSISSVLYPVLKIYAPNMLRKIIRENTSFGDLLKTLHLQYDKGSIKLTTRELDTTENAGHYLWDAKLLESSNFYVGDRSDYTTRKYPDMLEKIAWEDLFIPQFTLTGYVKKGKWENAFYVDYIGHTIETNYDKRKHHGKFPFAGNWQKKVGSTDSNNEFNRIVEAILFTRIKSGVFVRALPTMDTTNIVLSSKHKGKFGSSCIIYREPVVGKNNVYSVNIKYDEKLSPYCVRIPIDIVKAANGDYDGDNWAVLPYNDSNLNISSHEIKKILPDMSTIDITKEIKPRTEKELIADAIEHRKKKANEGWKVKVFGQARNKAAFSNDYIDVQKEILKLAEYLEVMLKREKQDEGWEQDIKEKIHKLEAYVTEEPVRFPVYGNWTFHELVRANEDSWKGLVGYKPGGFWVDLFNIPQTQEDKDIDRLKVGKTIYMGELK